MKTWKGAKRYLLDQSYCKLHYCHRQELYSSPWRHMKYFPWSRHQYFPLLFYSRTKKKNAVKFLWFIYFVAFLCVASSTRESPSFHWWIKRPVLFTGSSIKLKLTIWLACNCLSLMALKTSCECLKWRFKPHFYRFGSLSNYIGIVRRYHPFIFTFYYSLNMDDSKREPSDTNELPVYK